METKTCQAPVLNINYLIQNYINVYNNKDTQAYFTHGYEGNKRNESFYKETAKQYPPSPNMKQPLSPRSSLIGSISTLPDSDDICDVSTKIAKKQSQFYEQREDLLHDNHITEIVGFFLIGLSALLFVLVLYALIFSPLVGSTEHVLLDFIREDTYYCFLIPLLIPTTVIILYVNWVSVKFFRHT